jgi:hypothetical protein
MFFFVFFFACLHKKTQKNIKIRPYANNWHKKHKQNINQNINRTQQKHKQAYATFVFCLCFVCVSLVFFYVCQNPKILFSQNKILDFCLTQVLRKQNVCQTYVKHVGDISFTLAAGLYQVWISNWQLLDTGGTANSCFTYVANFTHMFCFMCHLCFNYIPFMFRLRSTYVLSYVWHMFHIRFTYVSFMFHICFYLRLDIVYVYVMPRPPSIETIPGAPLDQAKVSPIFITHHPRKGMVLFKIKTKPK